MAPVDGGSNATNKDLTSLSTDDRTGAKAGNALR